MSMIFPCPFQFNIAATEFQTLRTDSSNLSKMTDTKPFAYKKEITLAFEQAVSYDIKQHESITI